MVDRPRTGDDDQRRRRPLLLPCFYFVEIPLFGAIAVFAYLLHFTKVFSINQVIYDPSDVTISKPFTPEQNRTVPLIAIYLVTTAVPCVMIVAVECFLILFAVCCKWQVKAPTGSAECYIGGPLRRIIRFVGIYLFGLLGTSAFCDVLRKQIAALSPHFLSVCKPEPQRIEILPQGTTQPGASPNPLRLVNMYFSDECWTTSGSEELQEAKLNLPSYFVSLVSYTAVFSLLYLRLVLARAGAVVTSIVLCSTFLFPYTLGLIEVAENTSHMTSVMAGWALGAAIAYLLGREIFSIGFMPKSKCSRICRRKRRKKLDRPVNNVFEDNPVGPGFSRRGYHVAEDDITIEIIHREEERDAAQPKSRADEQQLEVPSVSPAVSRKSQPDSDNTDDQRKGHTAERKVIKELKNYILDTNIRGGLESPRPTQIRELSRDSARPNRKQVFSTFQATPEIEIHDEDGQTQNLSHNNSDPAKPVDLTTFGYIMGFHKAPPFEGRPFSYHGGSISQSSDGSLEDGALRVPGAEERPMSFSHHPRKMHYSVSKDSQEPTEGILSCFAPDGEPALLTLSGDSRDSSLLLNSHRSADSLIESEKDDDDASNLLKQDATDAKNDSPDEKDSFSDSDSSDETLTEDRPSIVV